MDRLLSHSRCIQCLALSKALKCKTDGGANKDQREQPCLPGLLSSHARRCCHSESRPCSFHAHADHQPPTPPSPPRATNPSDTVAAPLCQCLISTLTHRVKTRYCIWLPRSDQARIDPDDPEEPDVSQLHAPQNPLLSCSLLEH